MDSGSIANREDAEKCRDMAKEFMKKGEFSKAARFFDKSLKLYPLPGVSALKAKAEQLASNPQPNPGSSNHSSSRSSRSESSSGHPNNNSSSNSHNDNSSGNNNNSNSNSEGRPFTPEQESASQKVLQAAKRSHYEVLGVPKDADADAVKRAYRKLALKFHPDKNSAPSAEGAFKAISTAFDTLSDAAKRDLYDQIGHDGDLQQAQQAREHGFGGGFGGGFPMGGDMHGVSPDELFSFLFANAAPGMRQRGGFRTHTFHFGGGGVPRQQHQQQQQQQQPQGLMGMFQSLPMLLLIGMFLLSSFGNNYSQPAYSFRPSHSYPQAMSTSSRGVSSGIKYFVSESTLKQYAKPDALRKLEREVESDYRSILHEKCREEKAYKNSRLYQARFQGKDARERAEKLQTPTCDEYHTRFVEKFNS